MLRSWNIGLALGGGGFTATLQRNPNVDSESVLLRLLELPAALFENRGITSLIVFDEIQDVLAVSGADGKIRSVIQHQIDAATYAFAGSAPGVMEQLFADPRRPLLDQAVPKNLAPLPIDDVGDYVSERFEATGRDAGRALEPLLEFTRGHPQRSHDARPLPVAGHAARGGRGRRHLGRGARPERQPTPAQLMRAIWRALSVNERRVARAVAIAPDPLYSEDTATAVGIKRSSIRTALESLVANADVIYEDRQAADHRPDVRALASEPGADAHRRPGRSYRGLTAAGRTGQRPATYGPWRPEPASPTSQRSRSSPPGSRRPEASDSSLAGGAAVAREAEERAGCASGYASSAAAMLETVAIVGPAATERAAHPGRERAAAPERCTHAGGAGFTQFLACLAIRLVHYAILTAFAVLILLGPKAYAGIYRTLFGWIPFLPRGLEGALILTAIGNVLFAILFSVIQTGFYRHALTGWIGRTPEDPRHARAPGRADADRRRGSAGRRS